MSIFAGRKLRPLVARCVACALAVVFAACGGDDAPQAPSGPGGGPSPPVTGDVIVVAIDGGPVSTITEASGLPTIDCDPRVDWSSNQVVMWNEFSGGSGPNGYDVFLDIMFAATDTVGTYTVHDDFCQALYYSGGVNYAASPLLPTSDGTVTVTRSDTRIEGTFSLTVVDATGGAPIALSGSFGVDAGFSIVCP